MARRLGILGVEDSPYVQELERAANNETDVQVSKLRYADLRSSTNDAESGHELDALLVRSMPLGSLEQVIFRMDCLQRMADQGVRVINSPKTLETAIDKWLTVHRLGQAGLPVPPTVACQSREEALAAFDQLGNDVVVKPLFGGEGRGVIRVQDKDMAWRVFSTLQQLGSVIYVQQFCENSGFDVRILAVGTQTFAMRRRAATGQWKTNISQGSQAEAYIPTDEELDLATQAMHAVGGGVLAVDILPCVDGRRLILEVNAVPGWRGLSRACGVDIAQAVVRHALEG